MFAVLLLGSNDSFNLGDAAKALQCLRERECEPHDDALSPPTLRETVRLCAADTQEINGIIFDPLFGKGKHYFSGL